ncbi:four-carbon acid sugar kinase family protein, partial [Actinoalloteichus spitiensis]|uniref:four-carbon acid sugar kinase family protein n=1 Tax=Actinoalloteichus spitiensis TaxID=252394 RepID=UPI000689F3A2
MDTPVYAPADEIAPPRAEPRALHRLAEDLVGGDTVLVAVDDDPTGAQTVHDVPLVTTWSDRDLRWGLRHARERGLLFVLTNSRSMEPAAAHRVATDVATALARAAEGEGVGVRLLSRGDSTLRGHYPVETDALATAWRQATGQATDAVVLCPAYHEAGRVTVGGRHLVRVEGVWTPAERTEFSRDATFGFTAGDLPGWVAERSRGRVRPEEVTVVDLATIRRGGVAGVVALLGHQLGGRPPASPPAVVALDAAAAEDMEVTALALAELERAGHRFLYRTGPAYVRVRAGIAAVPPLHPDPVPRDRAGGVLVVVGSHTALTTAQTAALRAGRRLVDVAVPVDTLLAEPDRVVGEAVGHVVDALRRGEDVLLETSRALRRGSTRRTACASPGPSRGRWSPWSAGCGSSAPRPASWPRAASPPTRSPCTGSRSAAPASWGRCCPVRSRCGSPSTSPVSPTARATPCSRATWVRRPPCWRSSTASLRPPPAAPSGWRGRLA